MSASHELGWRIATLVNSYRFLVATALLVTFYSLREPRIVGGHEESLFQIVAIAYLLLGLGGLLAAGRRRPELVMQVRLTLLLDIIAVTLLVHASGGVQSGLGNLLIVSVGASALVLPARTALLFAALAAIAILAEQGASVFEGITDGTDFVRAGIVGAVALLLTILAQPVAQRLRESELLALQRGVDLANLAELNDYIIQHLRESILVLDADDTIRLINGSAARHLGASRYPVGRALADVSPTLHERAREWRAAGGQPNADANSLMSVDGTTQINPRFAPIGDARPAPTLVFLEDASALSERVQQTKLAALGRLSASIAHEIRNPVGAISHAGQLLGESERLGDEERRLAEIIHSHCTRVNEIIENVLQLSRREQAEPRPLRLVEWLDDFLTEFAASVEHSADEFRLTMDDEDIVVRMDPSHLHQVMWNLCENALRYAEPPVGEPRFTLHAGRVASSGRPFLEILDRGPGIDAALRQTIFEPFFTRATDGTGLGLFIARELAEVNGATLIYEPRDGGGSCFRVIFADPERWVI